MYRVVQVGTRFPNLPLLPSLLPMHPLSSLRRTILFFFPLLLLSLSPSREETKRSKSGGEGARERGQNEA